MKLAHDYVRVPINLLIEPEDNMKLSRILNYIAVSILIHCSIIFAQESSPIEFKAEYASIGDCNIYYKTAGKGFPLLLLHGFFGSSELWSPFVEDLSKQYSLIIPDLRGHGNSTNQTGKFTFEDSANDIFKLMAKLEIGQFDAIGYSAGGLTLLHLAIRYPTLINKLVLLGAGQYLTEGARQRISNFESFEDLSAGIKSSLLQTHKHGENQVRELIDQYHSLALNYWDPNFTPPLLSKISASTLIIFGDRDSAFSVELALEQNKYIGNSSLWVIPNSGHSLVFYDASPALQKEFIRITLDFLNDN
jgi:pimeloyl-ACP methyl ester carboxylesterase